MQKHLIVRFQQNGICLIRPPQLVMNLEDFNEYINLWFQWELLLYRYVDRHIREWKKDMNTDEVSRAFCSMLKWNSLQRLSQLMETRVHHSTSDPPRGNSAENHVLYRG